VVLSGSGSEQCIVGVGASGWRMDGRTALEMPLGIDPASINYTLLLVFRLTLGHRCSSVTHLDRNRPGRTAAARSDPMGQTWYCIDPASVVNSFTGHITARFYVYEPITNVIADYYGTLPQESLLLIAICLSVCLCLSSRACNSIRGSHKLRIWFRCFLWHV